ncbi:signal peptidase II [Mesoplasma lactucae]|uniref:Lipoprotein signal peptidase n=1 Tax=Mesoplasma lactucae ATCC 49193 TaxID=81460 RepID=A0A291IRW0_9MOLU|nr:signal peptidase II [Mesoplasma lactucae]ATG97478.1 lipoprotein signal peptidase [Mesoplasma lactucae ATCC 49193]ATZ20067.1 signal peptidase II [Mesoplasma lactucae ATCC 49193]MCL8216815.1 Lipoprotein signal peptidase [Mesoplasma lactucae ATCC 49193]
MTWTDNLKLWLKNHNYEWKFKLTVCLPLFVVLVLVDWATKIAVQFTMTQGQEADFIPHFLHLKFIINPGSAYGANAGDAGLAIALASIVTIIAFVIFIFLNDKKWLIAIVFILGGSFANLIARAWAPAVAPGYENAGQKGGVIDFLVWGFEVLGSANYIFNIADVLVNIGVIILVIDLIIEIVMSIDGAIKSKHHDSLREPENNLNHVMTKIDVEHKKGKTVVKTDEVIVEPSQQLSARELKAKQKLEKVREKQNGKSN